MSDPKRRAPRGRPAWSLTAWRRAGTAAALTALTIACQDTGVRPTATVQPADSADQVLQQMEHLVTENGLRRSRVRADTAYLYEGTQIAELRRVTVTFYDNGGSETSTVTADSGTYHMRDGSMEARGHVVARTPDGRHLTSEELKFDSKKNQISSDLPFIYDHGAEHLQGNGFQSDPDFKNVVTKQPRGGQRPGRADSLHGGILLPGQ